MLLSYLKPINYLRLIIPCITALSISSCASFESVKTTGKLAQNLDSYKDIYTKNPCNLTKAFQVNLETNQDKCTEYESNDTIRVQALELLSKYGKALEILVEDAKFDAEDQIGLVLESGTKAKWFTLTEDQITGGKTIGDATFKLIVNGVKRKALRKEFVKNNVAVQGIVNTLYADLVIRKAIYVIATKEIDALINEDSKFDADPREVKDSSETVIGLAYQNRLDQLTKSLLKRQIINDTIQVSKTMDALQSFGKAHEILAKNANKIGTRSDAEVVKELFVNLGKVFEGIEKLEEKKEESENAE